MSSDHFFFWFYLDWLIVPRSWPSRDVTFDIFRGEVLASHVKVEGSIPSAGVLELGNFPSCFLHPDLTK